MTTPLKIRASKAGHLMSEPKAAKDKAEGNLSEGAKTHLREIWIAKTYNRSKDFSNKYTEKGLLNEEISIDLVSLLHNELYEKNENLYANDWILGTPDILTPTHVIDVKSSYDIFTFAKAEVTDLYYWQLMCYMALTGIKKAKLIYCLTDSPPQIIERELRTLSYKLQDKFNEVEAREKLAREYTYNDIPMKDKVKSFELEYDESAIARLYNKIEKAREIYNNFKL